MKRYNPKEIEPKWQNIWDQTNVYTVDLASNKPKYLAMSMFNYPSGSGIHIGHAMNYTISDVKARFKRQQGYESYHPVGWDAFGLPAENYAIKTGVSPQVSMAQIIPGYHKQYKAMGWSNDWEKEISTHTPEYYKWTQWIFSQMHKAGLAYQDSRMQWWCPTDKTVLANEQVIDGKCWRHDGLNDPPAEKREVKQWFFKITDYAEDLLKATDELDWSEGVKLAQKNWIGKSSGAEIDFKIENSESSIKVFTTRPDTIFGATFLVLAPEHEILNKLSISDKVKDYIKQASRKSELERQETKEKTGVQLEGVSVINPATGKPIPVFVADYVLPGYGTGAIMAVPAHDERDHEFAKKFDLPISQVVAELLSGVGEVQFRPGEKIVERNVAQCVVWHPTENKVIVLEVPAYKWRTLVMGGIDEGEDWVKGAQREILEETGYKNAEYIGQAGQELWSEFWALHKNENRIAHFRGLVFKLKDLEQEKLSEHESAKHVIHWEDPKKAIEKFEIPEPRYFLECASDPGKFKPFTGEGKLINSGKYTGMDSSIARDQIIKDLPGAQEKINYRMNDWSVSRQRYWGAPIPIIHCPKCGPVLVPEKDLPVVLPELTNFEPTGDGRSALARAKDWLNVPCPQCGGPGERETDTMDTYVDSGWYMYRYMDPHNQQAIFDADQAKKWEPVDFYNGADHATAHLLYARFIGHFFKKLGLVDEPEPFKQFLFNGKVTASDGTMFSKSKGNGVDPLEIIEQGYGADALRTYLMFAAPLELWARWDPQGVPGTYRFLNRLWNITQEYQEAGNVELDSKQKTELLRAVNKMIKKVTADLEENRYNTAIASIMECLNSLYKIKDQKFGQDEAWQQALESVVACVAPFAPHIAEELWEQLGHSTSVHKDTWPKWDEKYVVEETLTIAVQINGKVRGEISVSNEATKEEVLAEAKKATKDRLAGQQIKKEIYVPGRLVSLVVSDS